MTSTTAKSRPSKFNKNKDFTPRDIYQEVTDKIVAALESGVTPWSRSWSTGVTTANARQRPLRANGTPYQGVNVLLLWLTQASNGYASNTWMTYNQAKALGGNVKRGEKGTTVVFASAITKTEQNSRGEDVERRIPFLKGYTVFNTDQIENLPEAKTVAKPAPVLEPDARDAQADAYFAALHTTVHHNGDRAFYSPAQDTITMPLFEAFKSAENYYSVLGHEHIHWTGHTTRLARTFSRFGDEAYAREELVAELGAAFLCADLGLSVEPRADHASYLASWLKVLKGDKRAIVNAASAAAKAVSFMHEKAGFNQVEAEPEELKEAA